MSAEGGLYVHLPFCPYICPYCDFAKWRFDRAGAERYLAALGAQIDAAPAFRARTLFFGGGTPNTYAPAAIAALVSKLRTRFELPPGAEATIEVNPDRGLCEGFAAYREAGINRLSIGVQSFVPAELRVLGRGHTAEDVREAVQRARDAGFDNVSVDLIFGVPGQTTDSWRASLEAALALNVEHISTYGLTVEEGTPYARWYARQPAAFADQDLEADLYGITTDALRVAGFEHYEISNFARPGKRCAHNENYWANDEYLGLGVGAASYLAGERATATRHLETYCTAALAGEAIPAEAERLEGAAQAGEAAMLALRTVQGVDLRAFAERYHIDFLETYASVLAELRAANAIEVTPTRVALTERGRYIANEVCAAFVEAPR